jgi:ABC-type dipeptide/oligopeptide/nickel transport system permease component
MLRYSLRRLLWAIPTLLATSLVLFLVTTLVQRGARDPEATPQPPAGEEAAGSDEHGRTAENRRVWFLDLPRFVNTNPNDVRSLSRNAMSHVAAADDLREASTVELQRLGGACFPYVLPLLESLPPDARRRVSVALEPIARRMGIAHDTDLGRPEVATLFWTRFWDDRGVDFTKAAAERAVRRLVEHGDDAREEDVATLDTLALPDVFRAMTESQAPETLARLTRIATRATDRGPELRPDASAEETHRALADWHEWWFEHVTDFVALEGIERITALLTDTQYGKWLMRIAAGELGVSTIDGQSIADKLRDRAPVTLLLCGLATLVSWLLAVPLGALGAWRHGGRFDVISSAIMFLLYATPTFGVAEVLRRFDPTSSSRWAHVGCGVISLSVASLATLSRWQRTAMLEVVRQDFVRTARAKGMLEWRVMVVHALRNALMPTVTVAGLQLPTLLGSAVVVEEVFGLHGMGFETMRAIEYHDVAWLMAVLIAMAIVTMLGLLASDIAYAILDPRVRDILTTREIRAGT